MIHIGLDFDDTYTADPVLFDGFIAAAQKRGHVVFVTTARFDNNLADIRERLPGLEIIASNGKPKADAVKAAGVEIDIWMDDMPWVI